MNKMNLPNKLTITRLVLVIPFIVFMTLYWESRVFSNIFGYEIWGRVFLGISLLIFIIAMVTDFFDGHIARKTKTVTEFGKLWDPLADKIITMTAFVFLVGVKLVPAWILIILVIRDIIVDGTRVMMAKHNIELSASIFGKLKTLLLSFGIIVVMLSYCIEDFEDISKYTGIYKILINHGLNIFNIIGIYFSIHSSVLYVKKVWPYLMKQ